MTKSMYVEAPYSRGPTENHEAFEARWNRWYERWCSACCNSVRDPADLDPERRLCPVCRVRQDLVLTDEGNWRPWTECNRCRGCGAWFHSMFNRPGDVPQARCDACWKAGRHALREMLVAAGRPFIYDGLQFNRLLAEDVARIPYPERTAIHNLGRHSLYFLNELIPYTGGEREELIAKIDELKARLREHGIDDT